jgi:hypothetical protein
MAADLILYSRALCSTRRVETSSHISEYIIVTYKKMRYNEEVMALVLNLLDSRQFAVGRELSNGIQNLNVTGARIPLVFMFRIQNLNVTGVWILQFSIVGLID